MIDSSIRMRLYKMLYSGATYRQYLDAIFNTLIAGPDYKPTRFLLAHYISTFK